MKLIVGLGNPGRKYAGTRHNVGFEVLAELASRHGAGRPKAQFQGEIWDVNIGGERTALLAPLTFMNLSGASVIAARDFFKLSNAEVLVVCDDFNLPLAKLRIRPKGTAGGQKGLADILRRLGDDAVPRLRLGIGPPPANWDVADYVLSKFASDELPLMKEAVLRAADAAADWVREGAEPCMNRYNA